MKRHHIYEIIIKYWDNPHYYKINDFILKGYNRKDILKQIRAMLGRRDYITKYRTISISKYKDQSNKLKGIIIRQCD